jgi:hypothetical protein
LHLRLVTARWWQCAGWCGAAQHFGFVTQNPRSVRIWEWQDTAPASNRSCSGAVSRPGHPGVTAAAFSNTLPLSLDQHHSTVYADTATD